MKLSAYLELSQISDAEFARRIGVERQAIGRYKLGERFPKKEILQEIYRITNGAVTPMDFVDIS